jgi:small GTP-binding protein
VIANKTVDSAPAVRESEGAEFARENSLPFHKNGFGDGAGFETALLAMLTEIAERDPTAFPQLVGKSLYSISDELSECGVHRFGCESFQPKWRNVRSRLPARMPDGCLIYSVVLLGDSGVGKTALFARWSCDSFPDIDAVTVGGSCERIDRIVDGHTVKLRLWDTSGVKRLESVTRSYVKASSGVFLVYDVCSRDSFQSLQKWYGIVNEMCSTHPVVFVIGACIDRSSRRQVTETEGEEFARANAVLHIGVSAKSGESAEEALLAMVIELHSRPRF